MKVGLIGLGNMGYALAQRLLSQGVQLVVWNRDEGRAEGLNVLIADSPRGVLPEVSMVILSLFDSAAVEAVLTQEHGLLTEELEGKIIIDTTTHNADRVERFHIMVKEHGGSYLEAPLLGSIGPALQGKLTMVVSGSRDVLDEATPLLQKFASKIFHLEPPGQATRVKLGNNVVLACWMAALAEGLALTERAGIPPKQFLEILAHGAGNSGLLLAKRDKLMTLDFSPHFSASAAHKDLHCALDLGFSLKCPMFSSAAVKELYAVLMARNEGDLDISALYALMREP